MATSPSPDLIATEQPLPDTPAKGTSPRLDAQLAQRLARLIDSQLGTLRERLLARGLDVGDLQCHPGIPPQGPRTRVEQRWVDENA